MTANTGVALALISRPGLYPDSGLSTLVRDAMHQAILLDPAPDDADRDRRSAAATTLLSSLDELTPRPFSPAESALFRQWLEEIPVADS